MTRAQAILDRDTSLQELRNRMEMETSKVSNKVMESLRVENIEHLRLHHATIESELRESHQKRVRSKIEKMKKMKKVVNCMHYNRL